jgi:deoxyadenosine/deoxycytidine kinase
MVFVVSLEGNIGSGKSTLLAALEAAIGKEVRVLQEPVDEWSVPVTSDGKGMLQLFYADRAKNGFAFQMFVLMSRVKQSRKVQFGCVVTERCVASDYELFGKPIREAGLMDDAQWAAYSGWSELVGGTQAPDAVAYLRVSPEKSLERVGHRRRDGEDAIAFADLVALHEAHEAWIARLKEGGVPVLELDGDADGDAAVQAHVAAIAAFLKQMSIT